MISRSELHGRTRVARAHDLALCELEEASEFDLRNRVGLVGIDGAPESLELQLGEISLAHFELVADDHS